MHKVLVARAVFPEVVERLRTYFDVEDNPRDEEWDQAELIRRLRGKAGAFITAMVRIDEAVLSACPDLPSPVRASSLRRCLAYCGPNADLRNSLKLISVLYPRTFSSSDPMMTAEQSRDLLRGI